MHGASGIYSQESFERHGVRAVDAEHPRDGSIHAKNFSRSIERYNSRRNVFENGLHELATPLEFLDRLLEVASELVDLRPAVAQLRGHGVEGAHQDAQLILSLLGNLVIEIAG